MHYIKIYGSITPLDAFRDLGITKLATVISDLKAKEHITFYQYYEGSKNRFGEPVHYMRYWLDRELFIKETEV